MTDILTPTKGLAQQTVGSNDDEWGDVLNDTIKLIDSALGGTLDRILTGDVTLTTTEIQSTGYHFRGTLLGTTTVIFPTYFGLAVIRNSADKPVACGMAGGRFVTIPPHGCSAIWSDGTDFTDVNQFLTVGGGLHGVDAVAGSGAEGGNLVSVAGAGDGNGTGGWASLAGGMGGNTAVGGGAELAGGNGGTIGGDATVRGGDAIQNGNGGHVWITSGKGKGAGHTAGNVILTTYKSEGGATPGDLRLDLGGGFFITGLPSTDPGRAGTFWLSNGVLIQSGKTLGSAVTNTGPVSNFQVYDGITFKDSALGPDAFNFKIAKGPLDKSSMPSCNVQHTSWWGIGFGTTCPSQRIPVGLNGINMETRLGNFTMSGTFNARNTTPLVTSRIGNLRMYRGSANEQMLDITNGNWFVDLDPTTPIVSGGAGINVNDRFYDAYDNIYTVLAVTGGAATSIRLDFAPTGFAATFPNPIALTAAPGFTGTGLTVNLVTTPIAKLLIKTGTGQTLDLTSPAGINLNNNVAVTGTLSTTLGLSFGSTFAASSTDLSKHLALYGTTYGLNVTSGRINYVAPTAAGHAFLVGSTAVTTVAPSGNLLIGTTTDGVYRLDVQSAGGSTRMARFSANPTVSAIGPPTFNNGVYILGADASQTAVAVTMDAFGTSPIFCGRRINGTAAVPTPLADNDLITGILAQGVGLMGGNPIPAGGVTPQYSIQAEGAWTQTSYGLRHVWRTIASGLTSSSEKMRLTASGNLLIGTTTDGTQKLDVAGNARVTGIFNVVGDIQQSGNILTLGNATISGTLNVGGLSTSSLATVQATKTGTAYTVANSDASLILNPSGTFTLTLPAASALSGRIILLKLIAAFAVNSATANVVPLAGGAGSTAIMPATAGKWCQLQSDGTNWQIMMAN